MFYFRQNEHGPVEKHFRFMHNNRFQMKKGGKNYQVEQESPNFEPKILNRSKKIASKYRQKILEKEGMTGSMISEKHLKQRFDSMAALDKEMKIQRMKKEKEAREQEELTLQPKTNKRMNDLYAQLSD